MSIERQGRVRALAAAKARELNFPWDDLAVSLGRPFLSSFTGIWRVSSFIAAENATVTLCVRETTGEVWPATALYRAPHRNPDWAFVVRRIVFGTAGGLATYYVATRWGHVAPLVAFFVAAILGFGAAVASIGIEPLSARSKGEQPGTDDA